MAATIYIDCRGRRLQLLRLTLTAAACDDDRHCDLIDPFLG
jgi:hypothetical protein